MTPERVIRMLRCLRCGHEWWPRQVNLPIVCPSEKCHSRYWNVPRKEKPVKSAAEVAQETRAAAGERPITGEGSKP